MSWRCKECGALNDDLHPKCWKCGSGGIYQAGQAAAAKNGKIIHCSTTVGIPGREVASSLGVVFGEMVLGTSVFRDLLAGLQDLVGARSGTYENKLKEGRDIAFRELMREAESLGADAVIGIDVDYETVAQTMLMICVSGTAVTLKPEPTAEKM
ncbi:YbjQ family protein [Luteolibacter flavescens]|uniref:UPF0145 protein OKA04_18920 n=1 Tax=Luteolibacter flavescens TaxID=1859460 RepID=A0ABT3FTC3_9BACT|nr:YbjQ family protein [Luteolibacter flavescens]MCW1886820.1 YbjQ family protein [Luteolibacter flavescens]